MSLRFIISRNEKFPKILIFWELRVKSSEAVTLNSWFSMLYAERISFFSLAILRRLMMA